MSEKYGKINLYRRDICLEKEELSRWIEFNQNSISNLLFAKSAKSYGVIKVGGSTDSFNCSINGSNSSKLNILGFSSTSNPSLSGSYALDENGKIIYLAENFSIDLSSYGDGEYYVKISANEIYVETDSVSIDINGNMSGSNFLDTLRGYSSGFPTYIKFYTKNDDGSYTIVSDGSLNNSVYEVAEVSSDVSAILSGDFVVGTNLYYAVLGSYALGSTIDQNEDSGLYAYNSCLVSIENYYGSVPSIDGENFYLAKIEIENSSIIALTDIRYVGFYYEFDTESLGYSERAYANADNIDNYLTTWRSKLDIYSKSEGNARYAYLSGGSNITSPDTWIDNLNLYDENKTGRFITSMTNAGLTDAYFSTTSWKDNGALIRSTFGRQARVDQFLYESSSNINYFPNLVASLSASSLGDLVTLSGGGRLICETSSSTTTSTIFRYLPLHSHREFRCIIDSYTTATTENGKWYEVVMQDTANTGWVSLVSASGATLSRGKAIQQGSMITLTGSISPTTHAIETVMFTIPTSIETASNDVDFLAGNSTADNTEIIQLYVDANSRNVRLREEASLLGSYSFCVTYPAV